MINVLASIVDELGEDEKAALLRAAYYLAALPGTEYDGDRLRRALAFFRGSRAASVGEPSQAPVSTPGHPG